MKLWAATLCCVLLLTQCNNEQKEKLVGIWRVTEVKINGTTMDVTTFGNWLWEFNEGGGYMVNLAGVKEKGTYKISDKELAVKSVTYAEKPETVYAISKLDAQEMILISSESAKNTTTIRFSKTSGEVKEED